MTNSNNDYGCNEIAMGNDVNPDYNHCTVCSGDTANNIWFVDGKCKLDQLTYEQVYAVLQRVPRAASDLQRITSDPTLLTLARETHLVSQDAKDDRRAEVLVNRNNTLPFYTVLNGNIDGTCLGRK